MNDIFREVDEEYRHEQLLKFWHENAKIIILALVLAIAGAAGAGFWRSHQSVKHQNETYALTHATNDAVAQSPADALKTLTEAAAGMTGDRAVLARFAIANATLKAGDKPAAIRIYDELTASHEVSSAERNLADILSISLQIQDGDPAQLSARLDKLSGDNNAFRFSARELQVLLAMRQGDMQKAHDLAVALAKDSNAPDGVHGRAEQLAALSGEGLAEPAIAAGDTPAVDLPEAQ